MLRSTMFIAVGLLFAVAPVESAFAQQFGNRGGRWKNWGADARDANFRKRG